MLSSNNNLGQSINDSEEELIQSKDDSKRISSCKQCFMFSSTILILVTIFFRSILYFIPKYATFTSILRPLINEHTYELISLSNHLSITLISNPLLTHAYGEMLIISGSSQFSLLDLPHLTELALRQNSTINTMQSRITDQYTSYAFYSPNSQWKKDLEAFSALFSRSNFSEFDLDKELYLIEHRLNRSFYLNDDLKEELLIDSLVYNLKYNQSFKVSLSYYNASFNDHFRNETYKYYRNHYYGGNMNLVLMSNMTLNEMKDIVIQNFTRIKGKARSHKSKEDTNESLMLQSLPLNKILFKYSSVRQEKLSLFFIIKEINNDYITQSISFISFLLMKGKESLFEACKLGNSLTSFDYLTSFNTKIKTKSINKQTKHIELIIDIELTQKGFIRSDEVISYLFQYIKHIQSEIKEEYYTEYQLSLNNTFNYTEINSIPEFIHKIAINAFKSRQNFANLLYNDYSLIQYNHTLIQSVFEQLNPDNLIIIINIPKENEKEEEELSKVILLIKSYGIAFENKTEPYLNLSYYVSDMKLSSSLVNLSNLGVFSPLSENQYIKQLANVESILEVNHSLLHDYQIAKVFDNKIIQMWYKFDNTFPTGRSYFYFKFILASLAEEDEEHYYYMILFYCELKNKMAIVFNKAKQGGNDIKLSIDDNEIVIVIDAYTELIKELFQEIIIQVLKVRITNQNFPYLLLQVNDVIRTQSHRYLFKTLIKRKANVDVNKFNWNQMTPNKAQETIYSNLIKGVIVALAYGRLSNEDVVEMVAFVLPQFKKMKHNREQSNEEYIKRNTIHKKFESSLILRQLSSKSSKHLLSNYYRIKSFTPKVRALSSLSITIIKSYMQVNTSSCLRNSDLIFKEEIIDKNIYLVMEGQSIQCNPKELNQYIEELLNDIYNDIQDMHNNTFGAHQHNTITSFKNPLTVKEKSLDSWINLNNNNTDILTPYLLKDIILNITQKEFYTFFKEVFDSSVSKLSIQRFSSYLGDWKKLLNEVDEVYMMNNTLTSVIINKTEKLGAYLI